MMHVAQKCRTLVKIETKLLILNHTVDLLINTINQVWYTLLLLSELWLGLQRLSMGILGLQANVDTIYEFLRVLATHEVNPLIILPHTF